MRALKANSKTEKGAELVEFALVLPLILVLCLGVIEFGRAYYTYNLLTKAVRDGARFGATSQVSSAGVLTNAAITVPRMLWFMAMQQGLERRKCRTY